MKSQPGSVKGWGTQQPTTQTDKQFLNTNLQNLALQEGKKNERLPVMTEILLSMRRNLELQLPHGILQAPSESIKKLSKCPLKFDSTH